MADKDEKGKINLGKMRQEQKEKQREEERSARRTESQLREEQQVKMAKERKEEAEKPLSDKRKKMDNFMYHHKSKVIGGVFLLVLLVVFAKDLFFSTKPDMVMVTASGLHMPIELTDQINELLTPIVGDINGDGKLLLSMDTVKIPSAEIPEYSEQGAGSIGMQGDPAAEAAGMMKLMAVVSAGEEHLFFLDPGGYEYLTQGGDASDLFEPLGGNDENIYGVPLTDTLLTDLEFADYLEDFSFYVRVPMKKDKINKDHDEALRIIEEIRR